MEDIRNYMRYLPDEGQVILIKERRPRDLSLLGRPLGSVNSEGYLVTKFRNKTYSIHRLAWYLFFGEWPKGIIDHINRDKLDNRLQNLRDTDYSVNNLNKEGSNGGCYYVKRIGKWRARSRKAGVEIVIGHFNSKEEAQQAYKEFHNESLLDM